MKRWVFMVGSLAIAWPLASYAQQPNQPQKRVGLLAQAGCAISGPVGNEPARINEIRETLEGLQASLCSMSRRAVGPRRSEPLPL
jgi:hypothetical protein